MTRRVAGRVWQFKVAARVGPAELGTFDMTTFLNGVPVIEQAVRRSDRSKIAWSFELWNERLLPDVPLQLRCC